MQPYLHQQVLINDYSLGPMAQQIDVHQLEPAALPRQLQNYLNTGRYESEEDSVPFGNEGSRASTVIIRPEAIPQQVDLIPARSSLTVGQLAANYNQHQNVKQVPDANGFKPVAYRSTLAKPS